MPLLRGEGLTKGFPGVIALSAVDFELRAGEIHTVMGENGAGKSTLIKLLTGVYTPDAGRIQFQGVSIAPRSPEEAQRLGIATVYQEVNLVPTLSVAENISLGQFPQQGGRIRWTKVRDRAEAALKTLGIELDTARSLGSFPVAIQQMVALARALSFQAKALILDEPTSSLDAAEVERLFAVMRQLKSQGMGILFVSHFLDQVYAVSDRITVLRNGGYIGTYEARALTRPDLIAKMLGRELDNSPVEVPQSSGPTEANTIVLSAAGLGKSKSVTGVTLEVRAGEILGFAGLLGSGRTEAARLLFGIDSADQGMLALGGTNLKLRSPRQAIRQGLGFVPEDRKVQGIVPTLSVRENIILAQQAKRGWWRPISRRVQVATANRYIELLKISTADCEKAIGELSGGNQQKALLARWLAAGPKLVILDEPTRGVDIGAKAEIEALIENLSRNGMAFIFISSELNEVVRDSHRIAVFRDRTIVGMLAGSNATEREVLALIAGVADE